MAITMLEALGRDLTRLYDLGRFDEYARRSDMANVVVSTVYVGANADLVRGFITAPLERVIAGADGIDYLE